MLAKRTEYALAGALALYIVFFTRPAPAMVVSILANPVAQIAALAAVIYVGATQSLVVAIVAALAVILSTPAREHMTMEEKDAADAKEKKPATAPAIKSAPKAMKKAAAPVKPSPAKDEGKKATAPTKPTPSEEEPAPGADKVAKPTTGGVKEGFSLLDAAPF